MPKRPLSPCLQPGCPKLAVISGRCREHARQVQRERERQRPSARERGYDAEWERLRAKYLAANPFCFACGEPSTDVDHIVPKSLGGSDDEDNLQALCHRCHSRKTATLDGAFGRGRQNR